MTVHLVLALLLGAMLLAGCTGARSAEGGASAAPRAVPAPVPETAPPVATAAQGVARAPEPPAQPAAPAAASPPAPTPKTLRARLPDGGELELAFDASASALAHGRLGDRAVLFVATPVQEIHGRLLLPDVGHVTARLRREGEGGWQVELPGLAGRGPVGAPPGAVGPLSGRWRLRTPDVAASDVHLLQHGTGLVGRARVFGRPAALLATQAAGNRWIGEAVFGDGSSLLIEFERRDDGALRVAGLGPELELLPWSR